MKLFTFQTDEENKWKRWVVSQFCSVVVSRERMPIRCWCCFFDSRGVCHWGGLVLQNNKMKSKEMHLLKRRMRRQKLVCLIYFFRAIKTFRSTSLLWIPSHELKYPVICDIERTAHHNSAHKYSILIMRKKKVEGCSSLNPVFPKSLKKRQVLKVRKAN